MDSTWRQRFTNDPSEDFKMSERIKAKEDVIKILEKSEHFVIIGIIGDDSYISLNCDNIGFKKIRISLQELLIKMDKEIKDKE